MLYHEIAEELIDMGRMDQEMRSRNLENPEYWDCEVDRRNTTRLKKLVDQFGWLTISKVGSEASHIAWLLVQHADHEVEFQEMCLELMKKFSESEVSKRNIAYLEDRVRVNRKLPQLFGTQFTEVDGKFVPREIEDQTNVDERRKLMGLGTIQETITKMEKKYYEL